MEPVECAICGVEFGPEVTPHLNHHPVTDKIRGWLCRKCDEGLKMFGSVETLEKALRFSGTDPCAEDLAQAPEKKLAQGREKTRTGEIEPPVQENLSVCYAFDSKELNSNSKANKQTEKKLAQGLAQEREKTGTGGGVQENLSQGAVKGKADKYDAILRRFEILKDIPFFLETYSTNARLPGQLYVSQRGEAALKKAIREHGSPAVRRAWLAWLDDFRIKERIEMGAVSEGEMMPKGAISQPLTKFACFDVEKYIGVGMHPDSGPEREADPEMLLGVKPESTGVVPKLKKDEYLLPDNTVTTIVPWYGPGGKAEGWDLQTADEVRAAWPERLGELYRQHLQFHFQYEPFEEAYDIDDPDREAKAKEYVSRKYDSDLGPWVVAREMYLEESWPERGLAYGYVLKGGAQNAQPSPSAASSEAPAEIRWDNA